MSLLGRKVSVIDASDESLRGRAGELVLETANTLLLRTESGTITIAKEGTVLVVEEDDEPVAGHDLRGRLEDRIRTGRL